MITESTPRVAWLSLRHVEVLTHMAGGKTTGQTASVMGIAQGTVEAHKYKMMSETGATTIGQLLVMAIKAGALKLEDIPDTSGCSIRVGTRVRVRAHKPDQLYNEHSNKQETGLND